MSEKRNVITWGSIETPVKEVVANDTVLMNDCKIVIYATNYGFKDIVANMRFKNVEIEAHIV